MNNKYKLSLLLAFIGIFFIFSGVMLSPVDSRSPNVSINTTLNTNMAELKLGQEIIIALDLDDYSDVKKGYNAYKATLIYDKDVFEPVTQNNFLSLNKWEEFKYNANTGEFVAIKKVGSKELENVVQVKLRVKQTVAATNTTISMTDIVTSEGKKDIAIPAKNVDVRIIKDQTTPTDSISTDISNDSTSNPSNNSSSNSKITTNNKTQKNSDNNSQTITEYISKEESSTSTIVEKDDDSDVSGHNNEKTYKKGTKKTEAARKNYLILYLIILIPLQLLLIILYKRRKVEDNKYSKRNLMLLLVGLFYFQIAGVVYASYNNFILKGELNGDSQIDYNDLRLLESHIIHESNIKNDLLENADMNSDGYITVTDLALLVQKLENTLDYEVKFSKLEQENKYVSKNDNISLIFKADVNYNAKIKKVKVNDIYYDVLEDSTEEGKYKVIVNGFDSAGIKKLEISEVLLDNEKKITTNFTESIEILKDAPKISEFKQTDDTKNSKVILNFNLDDEDNSFISGEAEFISKKDSSIIKKPITKGKNTLEFDVEPFILYTFNIKATYDCDSKIDSVNNFVNQELYTTEITGGIDYNLVINNVKTIKNNQESKYFEKNETINIEFESTNVSSYDISEVTINGKNYTTSKLGNTYKIALSGYSEAGIKTLTLEKVKLSNSKELEVESNNKVQIEVLKTKAVFDNYRTVEDINEPSLTILFDLIDPDNSITNSNVKFIDENNKVIKTAEAKKGSNTIKLPVEDGKKYKAKFDIEYNLTTEERPSDNNLIGTISLDKDLQLNINYNFIANNFKTYNDAGEEITSFEKDQMINIKFDSSNATTHEVSKIRINGKEYSTNKEDNKYIASIHEVSTFGTNTIKIDKITLDNNKSFDIKEELNVVIVKTIPKIAELNIVEDDENNQINTTFKIKDEDESILGMKVRLTNENNELLGQIELTDKEIKTGKISKVFTGAITSKYKVSILATYSQTDKASDIKTDVVLAEKEIEAIAKAEIVELTSDKTYYEKDSTTILTYAINTNKTEDITKITINDKEYDAIKLNDGKYQVFYKNETTSGVKSLKTTKVTYSNKVTAKVNKTIKIEVLKDLPTISNFKQVDSTDSNKVTLDFNLNDADDSLIAGEATLTNKVDGTVITKVITKGKNSLEFTVKELELYQLVLNVSYDRDTNTLTNNTEENRELNKTIDTRDIQLVINYNLSISDILTSKDEVNTMYFEKNEDITLQFKSTNVTNFEIVEITINDKKYPVIKNGDYYQTTISGYETSGVKNLTIEKAKLSNTKVLNITKDNNIRVEILKDKPTVKDFSYEEEASSDILVKFSIIDSEKAITSGKVLIIEDGVIIKEQELEEDKNTIRFTPKTGSSYITKVLADYDLDSNKLSTDSNKYTNETLLEEEISLGSRALEFKDITNAVVYKQTNDGVEEVEQLNISDLSSLDKYIVKVQMKEMPTFYTIIKEYHIDKNRLKLTLDYNDIVQYDGDTKQNKLEIDYGSVKNGTVEHISLEGLIKRMNANPSGTFELTDDYDASALSTSAISLVTETFKGTLNGNGHKISNLTKPLFNNIEGATIKNMILEDVVLSGANSKGSIANTATDTTITNIHVKGLKLTTGANHTAGMIGEATNTNVEQSSVTDFIITTSGHIRISAIIGQLTDGYIKNCYVNGVLNSTQSKDGNGIGGILGHGFGTVNIENCISKVKITNTEGRQRLNGAIVGLFDNNTSTLKNSVSLSTGVGFYSINGLPSRLGATNCYELADSGLISNAVGKNVIPISSKDINRLFYKENANFDETIWNLSGVSANKLPSLKAEPAYNRKDSSKEGLYIPDYSRIKKINSYDKNKEILYHNINKLMPYYDAKYLIEDAKKISSDSILLTKSIKHIMPYSNGKLLTYLTSENYNTITDIKVVFDDLKIENYKVKFKELNQNISIYELEEIGIYYAPNNYVIKNDASIVNTLKTYIEGLDYTTILDPLTTTTDARHYKDYYNETTKTLALNIALQLLQNDSENVLTINNELLNNKIKGQLIDSGKINKILYAYNYYYKWYNFEIGGARIADILLFENKMFKDNNNFENLINEVLVGNMAVGSTDSFFRSNIGKYTGSSELKYFLDYIITNLGGYTDVNDWFTEYFGSRNFLAEIKIDNRPELLYRGWYQLKKNPRMILPVINMPDNSTYMISGPAHLQFGPAQLYHKDTNTTAGKNEIRKVINNHATLVKRHLSVLAGSFGSLKWNNYCIMAYDCTKIITGYKEGTITIGGITIPTGRIVPVYTQGRVGSNYPFFKNFSEVLGLWQPAGSSGGVGSTAGFLWFQAQPGLTNYDTWTHEFEHALFDKIMLDQRGFRTKLEAMTQGNVEQRDDWSINNLNQDVGPYYFNTSFYLNKEGNATQNLTPDRIDTKEEMENYFKGQQNALDLLDYIEGKAFVKLSPEQQAKLATRVASTAGRTAWGTITAEQATQMNLTSLESLYDNQIILRPPNAWGASVRGLIMPDSTIADNYGYESVWVNRWYIDHYDGGYSGAFAIKRNFFEMLGYAGVEGYIIYGSRQSSSDLDAIRKITKLVTGTEMDWRQYKLSRYATVEENLKNNKYIDAEYMIQRFTEALINDANNGDRNASQRTNLRKIYYHYLKSATNDFIDDPLGSTVEVNHIKTAEELVQKINEKPYGYYVLDNDIDFSNMTTNVTQTFMGRLDGNGHKIIGNKLPIFNKIRYGYVGNIVFENTDIPKTIANAGALSYRAEMSTVEKISAKNLQMNFGGRNDISLISGAVSNVVTRDCNVEKLTHHISSADDFALLNEDTSGIFIIDNDIDFAGKTYTGTVVTNIFTGKIDGNGHTISNLENASLFANFRGTVENLKISNFTNTSEGRGNGDFVTAFTQESFTATFKNMRFENITLSGRNNVAVVSGADARDNANSIFENISVKNANVTGTGVYVSTFVGRKYGGKISNVFVQGNLTINSTENGGLVGSLQQNGTTIENVVTDVAITKTHNTYNNAALSEINGSMFGNIYNTPIIRNSIAFGNMTGYTNNAGVLLNPYKFTGAAEAQVIATMTNCYEVDEEIGSTRVSNNTKGKLNSMARANLNKEFYKNLGFDETIWNLDNLSSKKYPTLR